MLVSPIGSMVGPFPSNTGAVKRTHRMWLLSPAKPSQENFASEKEAEIAPKGSKGRFPSINFQVRSVEVLVLGRIPRFAHHCFTT